MKAISMRVQLLKPTKEKQHMYRKMIETNTKFANWLLDYKYLKTANSPVFKLFSTTEKLPSAVVNQTIRTVKSQKNKQKARKFKKLWCAFNNQNSKIEFENGLYKISFPTLEKRNRWFVSISISFKVEKTANKNIMGIDLGLKNIATCNVGTKSLFFKGNEVAFKRRKFSSRRRKLGKLKKLSAIKKSKDKESRWMSDMNHKISRQIINFAKSNGVGLIRMEDLTGIRMAISKKEAGRNLNNWSFYELQTFISYKAQMEGIAVGFVVPNYTSQTCKCGHREKNNRSGINFECKSCGYENHADLNASINIAKAISGISTTKKVA